MKVHYKYSYPCSEFLDMTQWAITITLGGEIIAIRKLYTLCLPGKLDTTSAT